MLFKKAAMMKAIRANDVEQVKALLDQGMKPNFEHGHYMPIGVAVAQNEPEILSLLLDRGATATETDMQQAIFHGYPKIVSLLADNVGVDMYSLRHAAGEGDLDIMTLLVDKNPSLLPRINEKIYGSTLLHSAAYEGHAKIVAWLLSNGADPDIENTRKRTPLFTAQERNHKQVEALLLPVTKNVVVPEEPDVMAEAGWKKLLGEKVALVTVEPGIGRQIMDIFNFHDRERLRLVQNLATNVEAIETTKFSDIDKEILEEALSAFNSRSKKKLDIGCLSGLRKSGPTLQ